jgi:deoxyribonuclease-4
MPLFGAHFSVAGGLHNAAVTAKRFKCPTFQLFTKNASQWAAPPLTDELVRLFKAAVADAKVTSVTAHDSYLINLAAPGDELFEKSINAFVVELERAEALGLDYLVTHPGAHVGSGEPAALARVIDGLNRSAKRSAGFRVKVLLETTAGQGTTLGWKFEHLHTLLDGVTEPERYGVCLDTCHVFAAGYDISTDEGYADTFGHFDELIGLDRLAVFHVNDSVKGVGCRVDRHALLGKGKIGNATFKRLAADPRFADRPMILETPKEDDDGCEMDPVMLKQLRGYVSRQTKAAAGAASTS